MRKNIVRELSKREQEVVELLAQGLNPKSRFTTTVRQHRDNIQASGEYPQNPQRAYLY
jgi:DNA-binding NarL/FixJ family response regulator